MLAHRRSIQLVKVSGLAILLITLSSYTLITSYNRKRLVRLHTYNPSWIQAEFPSEKVLQGSYKCPNCNVISTIGEKAPGNTDVILTIDEPLSYISNKAVAYFNMEARSVYPSGYKYYFSYHKSMRNHGWVTYTEYDYDMMFQPSGYPQRFLKSNSRMVMYLATHCVKWRDDLVKRMITSGIDVW